MSNFQNIDVANVKAVLLDLDDTLYPYEPSQNIAFEASKTLAQKNYNINSDDFEKFWKLARNKVHVDLDGQGASHSRLLYFHKQYEMLFHKSNPVYALEMEKHFWTTYLSSMQLDRSAEDFLILLRSKNIKTCIVTDLTAQIQMQKWIQLGLDRYIDFLVSSEEAGVEKPSSTIFKLALIKLQVSASEVIMIGDNETKDIAGAEAMGIRSYLIKAKC